MSGRRLADDQGTAGVEAAIAVVALLGMLFFIVGALRVTNAGGDVDAAARAAARAAAAERDMGSASASAAAIAASALASRGVACAGGPAVAVGGSVAPGGVVTVTVTCTVALMDARLGGFGGSRTVVGHGVEAVDSARAEVGA